jgi:hypothetical protein
MPRRPAAPDVGEVRRIVAIESPAIRNLEITHAYSRLAAAFAAQGAGGANWCTFATWASRQAGRTIRGEDMVEHVGRRLGRGAEVVHPFRSLWRRLLQRGLLRPESRIGRLTAELHTPFDAIERASAAVARGNLKVFEEIGLEFARYLGECTADEPPDEARIRRFVDSLRPGELPDGQDLLRRAFTRYARVRSEGDPKARAELLVLANLEIGLHEQTRLQPEIRAALDAPYGTAEDLGERLLRVAFPSAARRAWVLRRPAAAVLGAVAVRLQREASGVAREVVTESFMVLSLPGRVLMLGAHLDEPYPDLLREPADRELAELLARYEPEAPEADDCGARDWADLDQRMHYLVHLFLAFHATEDLARPPFTPAQVESFTRGVVPDGLL